MGEGHQGLSQPSGSRRSGPGLPPLLSAAASPDPPTRTTPLRLIYEGWLELRKKSKMDLNIYPAIKGLNKFNILKQSSLLFFPSRFEGFGIPPLEAAYCKLPCACSNLPVLKEYGHDIFHFGNPDDISDMKNAVLSAIDSNNYSVNNYERISSIAKMEYWGQRLIKLLEKII